MDCGSIFGGFAQATLELPPVLCLQMEAEKDMMAIGDSRLVEADTSLSKWYSSNLVEKMQSIALDFHGEPTGIGFPRYSLEDDLSPQTASQMLWELGSFDCRIPNGFYSVIPNKLLKERFDTIPSPQELRALGPEGIGADALLVDSERDKKLEKLKEFTVASVKGLSSNPALTIKKIAEVVYDFYGGPMSEAGPAKHSLDDSSTSADNFGVQLLGKIKIGLCRPRAILFKVLADAIGLRSRLLVGLQVYDRVILDAETYKHMSLLVGLNSTELLVDMMRSPGQLIPLSRRALIMYHFSGTGESDSADNDSCDSPLEPGSPMFGFSEKFDSESPEHSFPRARGRSMLSGHRQSFLDDAESVSASSPDQSPQHGVGVGRASVIRRRSISSLHSSIENERPARAMNEIIKRERYLMKGQEHGGRDMDIFNDHGDEDVDSQKPENVLKSNMDDHKAASTTKEIEHDYGKNIGESTQKTVLVSLSQGELGRSQSTRGRSIPLEAIDLITSWNQVVQSTSVECDSFLPFPEWNIDPDELKIGIRVGIGSFGEVFRGIWRGTDVAIKVLLEQDLTMENMEDFCNEISLLSRLRHPNVILFLGACTTPPHLSMVTEYMHKGSLYYLLHTSGQGKKLSWRRRLKMLRDICRGMMCIQRMNIVHRDLKSANCLVDKHWTVKICDFGLSQIMTSSPLRDSKAAGTPEWMAPELLRSESFTEKCDIFSLGVIMWELCTLKRPWEGVKPVQVVYAVAHEGARLDIPEGPIGKLISDCWADDPDARPCYEEIFTRLHECEFLVT